VKFTFYLRIVIEILLIYRDKFMRTLHE